MPRIFSGRHAATMQGDFVVFLIGMRINQLWNLRKWMPVARAMPRMLQELAQKRELGLLHAYPVLGLRGGVTVQYWRSFEHLHDYAHAKDAQHLPAWAAFNRAAANNAAVGIWHETYRVQAGSYEAVYVNMPLWGLAAAGSLVPAVGRMQSARSRITPTQETE